MSWKTDFLAARDLDPDSVSQDRKLRQARRPAPAPSPKDVEQDAEIRALRRETHELKVYLAGLVSVLQRHQFITSQETEQLISTADRLHSQAMALEPSSVLHHGSYY